MAVRTIVEGLRITMFAVGAPHIAALKLSPALQPL